MSGHFPDDPEKIAEKSTAARVAVMLTMGSNINAISKELGISYARVKSVMKSDECLRVMREIANHEKEYAKARAAQKSGELIDECFRVIKARLKKDDLKAVALTLKSCGVFDEIEQIQNDAQLVVIMPGASPPNAIDVTPQIENVDHPKEG